MDKTQAEAIAQAILEPDLRAREEFVRKREKQAVALARQRKVARAALAGAAMGIAGAYLLGGHIVTWALQGSIFCGLLAQLGAWLGGRSRRR
ncbi:hypothetical protein [Stenotrophomonas sp. YIM B06876]|uniref:hypothetical protein n=1 Tax=Stenotrophomonas sp. YIM B06876 TaxID=3060211 RepID=UPI00273876E0|nr:hypothetical protein [Stenotrophomonas sp. YIM B06876]